MANLLTSVQQQLIKSFSANNLEKYTQIATEVEDNELMQLIGVAFLQAIQTTPADYNDLLNGSEFEDYDGNTINHKGLRYVLAYFNYSKYLGESFVADTYTGFVRKTHNEAEPLTEGQVRRLQEDNRKIALQAWSVIKRYLDISSADYPLWSNVNTKKVYRPKFFGISKTEYR